MDQRASWIFTHAQPKESISLLQRSGDWARIFVAVCLLSVCSMAQSADAQGTASSHPLSAAQVKELKDYIHSAWTTLRRSDRKSTRLNSSHVSISYAVFCLKKKTPTHSIPH